MSFKHVAYDQYAPDNDSDNSTFDQPPPSADPSPFASVAVTPLATNAAAPLTETLYLTEPGTTTAISVSDLFQGQIGDCFLISSIGELALDQPLAITNMIKANTDGTETVTLYTASNGTLPNFSTTAFKPISINVTNVFPTNAVDNGSTQDVVGSVKEIWPQVLEKAFAILNGGYNAISNGGYPVLAMEELTGKVATAMSPASLTTANLNAYIAAGDLITMDTSSNSGLPDDLVSNHTYMFEGLSGSGANTMVKLGNPWGYDQPSLIRLSQLSAAGIVEVDVGRV